MQINEEQILKLKKPLLHTCVMISGMVRGNYALCDYDMIKFLEEECNTALNELQEIEYSSEQASEGKKMVMVR